MQLPKICVTLGDPAGIGPEVVVKALADESLREAARWLLVGEAWQVDALGFTPDDVSTFVRDASMVSAGEVTMGTVSAACGRASLDYVKTAVDFCLEGQADAMVTAPLCKEAVAQTEPAFVGHTEYLAELCGVDESRILLVNDKLWVANVTAHCRLTAATKPSVERIFTTIRLAHDAMVRFGRQGPRLAVCGLNPHAGEAGIFGDEEKRLIMPAIERARDEGIDLIWSFRCTTIRAMYR